MARDVTERRQVEELREEFLSLAAHELKTPLTILKGLIQMLQRRCAHDEIERRFFQVIGAQGDRLAHLVQALVDAGLARSGRLALDRRRFDLCGLVRDVARQVQVGTGRHQLTVTCEGQAEVEADRMRIGEVIFNLLDNAVKYSPRGGPVDLTVQAKEGEAVVCVRDHGLGIPREQQARLFEAFYQVAPMMRPTTGMGLGLYVGREIVHRHGGRIWFTSVEGEGSTFCFSLPQPL